MCKLRIKTKDLMIMHNSSLLIEKIQIICLDLKEARAILLTKYDHDVQTKDAATAAAWLARRNEPDEMKANQLASEASANVYAHNAKLLAMKDEIRKLETIRADESKTKGKGLAAGWGTKKKKDITEDPSYFLNESKLPRCFCGKYLQNIATVIGTCKHPRCILCFNLFAEIKKETKCLVKGCKGEFKKSVIGYIIFS